MSECKWCDQCDRPYPDSDVDAQAMQVQVPEIINGIKRNVITIERHQCGDCTRRIADQRAQRAQRRALTEATADPE